MATDSELLRRYAETRSEEAFAELARRHVDLVYSAALRQVNGDAHAAEDVTQQVFSDLAGKAAELSRRTVLTGWLYTSAHYAAAKIVRGESRRRAREQEAITMHDLLHDTTPGRDWDKLRPVLDEAMHELKDADREAVLLRYFENRPFTEIGAKLGLNENAARMRADRALDKLHGILKRRGVTLTAAALGTVLAGEAVSAAPVGLAVTITTAAALAGTTATATTTLTATKAIAMTALQKTVIAASLAVVTGTVWVQTSILADVKRENASLRAAAQNLDQLRADNMEYQRLLAQSRESDRLRQDSADLERLRNEIAQLKPQAEEADRLRGDNQRSLPANGNRPVQSRGETNLLDKALAKENEEDERSACFRNLGQMGKALTAYVKDHDGVYPANFPAMSNYLSPNLLSCPGDASRMVSNWADVAAGKVGYRILTSGAISNADLKKVVIFQCPVHGAYCFADGHVMMSHMTIPLKVVDGKTMLDLVDQ